MRKNIDVEQRAQEIGNAFDNCVSVFVYGSYARNSSIANDCEMGVLLDDTVGADYLNEFGKDYNTDLIKFFPFSIEEFVQYNITTTFTKNIFYNELLHDAYTVYGEDTVESLESPEITLEVLKRDIGFQIGQAFSGLKSYRRDHLELATDLVYKSGLFGARLKHYAETGEFITGYKNIAVHMENDLLSQLLQLRTSESMITEELVYNTLSYLRGDVEQSISSS